MTSFNGFNCFYRSLPGFNALSIVIWKDLAYIRTCFVLSCIWLFELEARYRFIFVTYGKFCWIYGRAVLVVKAIILLLKAGWKTRRGHPFDRLFPRFHRDGAGNLNQTLFKHALKAPEFHYSRLDSSRWDLYRFEVRYHDSWGDIRFNNLGFIYDFHDPSALIDYFVRLFCKVTKAHLDVVPLFNLRNRCIITSVTNASTSDTHWACTRGFLIILVQPLDPRCPLILVSHLVWRQKYVRCHDW